jgi:hypothetical protein
MWPVAETDSEHTWPRGKDVARGIPANAIKQSFTSNTPDRIVWAALDWPVGSG